ncbi:hypothetical protein BC939DRAFT_491767 [Gamsiella multidivaricata]|uniref:uncharacterized protein n=1 Tax=Gamsiella multidivaricata TaxID=101098 RepID=UPI00221FDA81|nr:uncharacterized protein BC939DRAFT_491767 [Gamsiella multidivaricata]KAI7826598.1 hypothetical protein BC939DRAFT_491767 [Gamsiella multidivaricata]
MVLSLPVPSALSTMLPIVLRIKDILHFAPPDVNPLDPITPFAIPPQSVNPLILTFTCQEFRAFWAQERRAYDWQYRTAAHSKFYRQDHETPCPTGPPTLPHMRVALAESLSLTGACSTYAAVGINQKKSRTESFLLEQIARHPSLCGKSLKKTRFKSNIIGSIIMTRLPQHERNCLADEMTENGSNSRLIKAMIGSRSRRSYVLIKSWCKTRRIRESQKDKDLVKSIELWLQAIREKRGKTLFDHKPREQMLTIRFLYSFFTICKVMADNNSIYCMDSTHKTVTSIKILLSDGGTTIKSAYLFTLLVAECMQMRPLLKEIRKAKTAVDQERLWAAFKRKFPTATTLIEYIENRWLNEHVERWTAYHRMDGQEVTTNNWVESWHKTLKQKHLGHERNVRADYLVYLLEGAVDADFRVEYFKIKNGLAPPPLRLDPSLRERPREH